MTSIHFGDMIEETNDDTSSKIEGILFCEICQKVPRQYKCPRCDLSTCSLVCCKLHKEKFSCDGKRDKTKFVGVNAMNSNTLRSDFHFLEDILQLKEHAKRDFITSSGDDIVNGVNSRFKRSKLISENVNNGSNSNLTENIKSTNHAELLSKGANNLKSAVSLLPINNHTNYSSQNLDSYNKRTKALVKAAKKWKINLLLQPKGMSRRNKNSSYYNTKSKEIHWKCCFVFLLKSDYDINELINSEITLSKTSKLSNGNSGSQSLEFLNSSLVAIEKDNILGNKHLDLILREVISAEMNSATLIGTIFNNQKLLSRIQELRCFARIIPSPANDPLFMQLQQKEELSSTLTNLTILEYPIIYVSLPEFISNLRFTMIMDEQTGDNSDREESKFEPQESSDEKMECLENEDEIEVNETQQEEENNEDKTENFPLASFTSSALLNILMNQCDEGDDESEDAQEENDSDDEKIRQFLEGERSSFVNETLGSYDTQNNNPVKQTLRTKYEVMMKNLIAIDQEIENAKNKQIAEEEVMKNEDNVKNAESAEKIK